MLRDRDLVQPRKTRPNITEKLLTGTWRGKSNKQTNVARVPVQCTALRYTCPVCKKKLINHHVIVLEPMLLFLS